MAATKRISVALPEKHHAILQKQLRSGRYETATDVFSDPLVLMTERDAVFDEWLRQEVRASIADPRPARPLHGTFKRIRSRIARTAKASKRARDVVFLHRAEDRLAEFAAYIAQEAGVESHRVISTALNRCAEV